MKAASTGQVCFRPRWGARRCPLTAVVVWDRHTGRYPVMAAPLQTLVAHPDDTDEARRAGMRDPSASLESSATSPSSTFALPDADMVYAAWLDLPSGSGRPSRPDKAKSMSAAMLVLGVA